MELWTILGDIVVLLVACLLLGGLMSRLGQSPLVGYLIAGMLLGGPGGFQLVKSNEEIEAIAELGVALLLFSLGLEFSFDRLKRLGSKPLIGGVIQIVVTILLAAAIAYLFGVGWKSAVAFGVMICLSSTAIVLRMLMERGEVDMPHGRSAVAVLLTQDMAVVPLALVMTILGGRGEPGQFWQEMGALLLSMTLLVVGLLMLTRLANLTLELLTVERNRELAVIFAVVMGLGAAWAAHYVEISPALGAFVAGMMLGSSAFATQIRADVASLRVVLLTLFFGAVGMIADPIWMARNWYLVALVTLLIVVGKTIVITIIFRALRKSVRTAAAVGLSLAQVGEFAFVLGKIGRDSVVGDELHALVVSVAIVSLFLSALLVPLAPWFGNQVAAWWGRKPAADFTADPAQLPQAVIIGFGPSGQLAASSLVDRGVRVGVIDLNAEGVRRARELGFMAEIGDATQAEVLKHAHVGHATAVVITVPHFQSALAILGMVRQEAPEARVYVRARYQMHADQFANAGADYVVGDELQVGERLASLLNEWSEECVDEEMESKQ